MIDGAILDVRQRLIDDGLTRCLARSIQERVIGIDRPPHVKEPGEDEDEEGQDERELDQRLPSVAPPGHLFAWM
jgi:hypothetical protein